MNTDQSSRIVALARQQGGVVTRQQAFELELTSSQWHNLSHNRMWARAGSGVLRLAGVPLTWEQRVWIACLESGGHASHKTAGWLWRLDGLGRSAPKEVDVTVHFDNRCTTKTAKVHRSRTLTADHLAKPQGIPRTTLARTV